MDKKDKQPTHEDTQPGKASQQKDMKNSTLQQSPKVNGSAKSPSSVQPVSIRSLGCSYDIEN